MTPTTQRSVFGPWSWRDMLFACGCSLVLFGISPAIQLLLLAASLESGARETLCECISQLYEAEALVASAFAFGVGLVVLYVADRQHNHRHRDRLSPLLWQDVRATKVALRAVVVACTGQLVRQQALRISMCHHDNAVESAPMDIAECFVFRPSDALLVALVAAASLTLLSLARCAKPPPPLLPTTVRRRQQHPRAITLASAA